MAVVVLGNVLKKDLKAIEARHGRAVRVAYAKVARAALKVLIEKAPVDTGQLVSNYRVGLGRSAPRAQIDPYAPGKKGSTAGANRAAAYAAAAAKLTNIKDLSQDIRIVNTAKHWKFNKDVPAHVDAALAAGEAAMVGVKVFL